jgi:hypothetical protein
VPEGTVLGEEQDRIGFTLELRGSHEADAEHAAENCTHCHNVFASLHVIADWILPREKRALMHEAELFFPCQIYSPARQRHAGMRFGIRVVHREAPREIAEECLVRWQEELERNLNELGLPAVKTQDAKEVEMNARVEDSQIFKGVGSPEPAGLSRIKDLVQRHKVCWESIQSRALIKSGIRSIGFALELYGTHQRGTGHVDPGCEHCRKLRKHRKRQLVRLRR